MINKVGRFYTYNKNSQNLALCSFSSIAYLLFL